MKLTHLHIQNWINKDTTETFKNLGANQVTIGLLQAALRVRSHFGYGSASSWPALLAHILLELRALPDSRGRFCRDQQTRDQPAECRTSGVLHCQHCAMLVIIICLFPKTCRKDAWDLTNKCHTMCSFVCQTMGLQEARKTGIPSWGWCWMLESCVLAPLLCICIHSNANTWTVWNWWWMVESQHASCSVRKQQIRQGGLTQCHYVILSSSQLVNTWTWVPLDTGYWVI